MKFNGVSLFARYTEEKGSTEGVFLCREPKQKPRSYFNHLYQCRGSSRCKSELAQKFIAFCPTINTNTLASNSYDQAANNPNATETTAAHDVTFATESDGTLLNLDNISVGVITQALENISFLRAQNGGSQSRLAFNLESLGQQKTNMRAALGRIVDVDMAEETTNLAKYSVLSQASASILAQANASTDVA